MDAFLDMEKHNDNYVLQIMNQFTHQGWYEGKPSEILPWQRTYAALQD